MKQFVAGILCLWIGCTGAAGQAFRITKGDGLPRAEIRFKPGDNPAWADSAFSDQAWQKADLSEKIDLTRAKWPNNRGWYRIRFRPRLAQVGQDLSLVVEQFGASELYLNGRPLAKLRPLVFDSGGSQRITRFIPVQFADTTQHVLAIRYQFRPGPVYVPIKLNPVSIYLAKANEAGADSTDFEKFSGTMSGFFASVFGLLALLHLLFYRANRYGRTNRTLAWTMLALFVWIVSGEAALYVGTLTSLSVLELISMCSVCAGFVLMLIAVYQYLHIHRNWLFYVAVGLLIAAPVYRVAEGNVPDEYAWIPYVVGLICYIRVSWLGRRSDAPDARLPWNSLRFALYSMLFILLYIISVIALYAKMKANLEDFLFIPFVLGVVTMLFSIPVGLSLSLVRDYARTHQALGDNLREVEQLSARTLAQEQEKQQLLARQNELLDQQVQERTIELNNSLIELRATQVQLVQREKLASLGELTAGIAHEIQNPLNFVTNFAEVSVELVDELNEEQKQPASQRDNALIDELLGDLGQNVQKISEHGKRAASIVRGMLQHSRTSTGRKYPTNLNALVDESMKLAYHGLRATDKSFNAQLQTDFSTDIPTVSIVPEDVGRVLVNLFNNAFYAVKQADAGLNNTMPTVSARTAYQDGQAVIQIQDNGPGIPDAVRQKIFQPFFTTKPTGEGTGLGLSISYDIITKGHGGTLNVDTEPGRTVFTIRLPV